MAIFHDFLIETYNQKSYYLLDIIFKNAKTFLSRTTHSPYDFLYAIRFLFCIKKEKKEK